MKTDKSPSRPGATPAHRRYEDVEIEFMGPEDDRERRLHDPVSSHAGQEIEGLLAGRDLSSKRRLNGLGSSYAVT